MGIQNLIDTQTEFKREVRKQLELDSLAIKQLAEDMAEAATNIQGQGLQTFIQTREQFLATVQRTREKYCTLLGYND